ncbi:MAG TPA: 6,7-dimethyl-8-ribityllumazine synthase [Terriglobales bacterium]|nr:6,7-dimethyl-8-ribityllumazine synthase [Terriglobales bacterium]
MLKSLHIGRYVTKPEDLRALTAFLEAIGFQRFAETEKRSAVFSAPVGLLSVNELPSEYPKEVLDHLKDINRLIVLEVSNPDDVFAIAQKQKLKVLMDSASPKTGERSFSLALPGEIIVTVHGLPEELPAGQAGDLKGAGRHFAIVVSRFNAFITERLLQGALDGLRRSGARREDIEITRVPGSFEIPSAARMLAESGKYDAIICLGCLLRGDTAHYDVIVNECARGIGQSAQETGVPHAFGVLTCDTLEQAIDRAGLKMGNKGFEAALTAVEMASLKEVVSRQSSGRKSSVASRQSVASAPNGKNAGKKTVVARSSVVGRSARRRPSSKSTKKRSAQ